MIADNYCWPSVQVAKWMLGKGQGMTMGTFDTLLLAFDMDGRVDEAESFWNMILHTHTRSISKRLFSRMICLYDHHNNPEKVIEVFKGLPFSTFHVCFGLLDVIGEYLLHIYSMHLFCQEWSL